jgi:DNA-binding response OmpR family regulator
MIHEILEAAGYTVLASAEPEEALRRLAAPEVPIHLLLTDVVMPRLSGPELARNVRIARHEIKVLFMSGYTDEALGLHGVLGAGTQFIQKPFTTLLGKVREALDEPYGRPAPVPGDPAQERAAKRGPSTQARWCTAIMRPDLERRDRDPAARILLGSTPNVADSWSFGSSGWPSRGRVRRRCPRSGLI